MESQGSSSFPSKGFQVLSCLIVILGVSVLTHCLSRRLSVERWTSWNGIKEMSWARLCVLLVFFDSWLFICASGILIFGVGLESQGIVCGMGIYLCVLFYATSKLLIYSFLVEKVHLVWSPTIAATRRRSPIYLACMTMIALYGAVITLMIVGKIHYMRESDGMCIIGLKRYASLALLAYDLLINVVLTLLFLWPVLRTRLTNPRLKRVAIRTLVASGVALTTSTVNMLVLSLLDGHEQGWICLGSCGADVVFNAFALFWVTKTNTGTTELHVSSNIGNAGNGNASNKHPSPPLSDRTTYSPPLRFQSPPPCYSPLLSPKKQKSLSLCLPRQSDFGSSSQNDIDPYAPFSSIARDMEMQLQASHNLDEKTSVIRSVVGIFRNRSLSESERDIRRGLEVKITTDMVTDDGSSGTLTTERPSVSSKNGVCEVSASEYSASIVSGATPDPEVEARSLELPILSEPDEHNNDSQKDDNL